MSISSDALPPRGRPYLTWAGTLCLALFVAFSVPLGFLYVRGGRYQPQIPPPLPPLSPNAISEYMAAEWMLEAAGGTRPVFGPSMQPWQPTLANERMLVARNQEALAHLRVALKEPCRVPAERNLPSRFEYLTASRDLARLLQAEGDVRSADGGYEEACESGLDAIQMGLDMARGGRLPHAFTSGADQAAGRELLLKNLERLSGPECEQVAARLRALTRTAVAPADIYEQERAAVLTYFLAWDKAVDAGDRKALDTLIGQRYAPDGEGLGLPFSVRSFPGRVWWRFHREPALRQIDRYFGQLIDDSGRPPAQRKPLRAPTDPLAHDFVPAYWPFLNRWEDTGIRNRLLVCALGIRHYRLTRGRLPDSLQQTGLAAEDMLDTCSGKPFVYRPEGADYLLYSIGPDLRDDGGVPANEGDIPPRGDIGLVRFAYWPRQFPGFLQYRRVPHMKPPALPPGAPPLNRW